MPQTNTIDKLYEQTKSILIRLNSLNTNYMNQPLQQTDKPGQVSVILGESAVFQADHVFRSALWTRCPMSLQEHGDDEEE